MVKTKKDNLITKEKLEEVSFAYDCLGEDVRFKRSLMQKIKDYYNEGNKIPKNLLDLIKTQDKEYENALTDEIVNAFKEELNTLQGTYEDIIKELEDKYNDLLTKYEGLLKGKLIDKKSIISLLVGLLLGIIIL